MRTENLQERTYKYSIRLWWAAAFFIVCNGGTAYLWYEILYNGAWEAMSHYNSDTLMIVMYVIIGLLTGSLVLMAWVMFAVVVFNLIKGPPLLVVSDTFIKIPQSLLTKEKLVYFKDIVKLMRLKALGYTILHIRTNDQQISIGELSFKSSEDFESVASFIKEKSICE